MLCVLDLSVKSTDSCFVSFLVFRQRHDGERDRASNGGEDGDERQSRGSGRFEPAARSHHQNHEGERAVTRKTACVFPHCTPVLEHANENNRRPGAKTRDPLVIAPALRDFRRLGDVSVCVNLFSASEAFHGLFA